MKRRFRSRAELTRYLVSEFPEIAARGSAVSEIKGGRKAAERALERIDPVRYGRTRSSLEGAVTRLSPYLRHGVLTLAQVRDAALERADARKAYKLLDELSWRDYFQRIYAAIGNDIWLDFEPYKTGYEASNYAQTLPDDLRNGRTGAVCIDSFVRDLETTGYLHNHVRLWLSAYVVHWRRVSWQTGARWFLEHLLDGDPASNALGWQWVASTWRRFPYIWNRGNLIKNAGMRYCESCPLFENGCPFAGTYAALSSQLFSKKPEPKPKGAPLEQRLTLVPDSSPPKPRRRSSQRVLVWVHGDALQPDAPTLLAYPDAPALYIWDEALLELYQLTLKRLQFLYECLLELPVDIARGDPVGEIIARARAEKRTVIATMHSVAPKFSEIVQRLELEGFDVQIWPEGPFAIHEAGFDLRSHASYYRVARKSVEALGTKN
jgi:deoxyribodipyrimidine photo-lyase